MSAIENEEPTKKRGRKANPVTKQEIAEMLQSVISYCQQSGIEVRFANQDDKLHLAFDGLNLDGNSITVSGNELPVIEAEAQNG